MGLIEFSTDSGPPGKSDLVNALFIKNKRILEVKKEINVKHFQQQKPPSLGAELVNAPVMKIRG